MIVRPKMVLHCVAGSTMLHTRAANIPKQMTNWFTLPSVPRKCVGATCTVPWCNQLRPALHSTQPIPGDDMTQHYATSLSFKHPSTKLVTAHHTVDQHCAALLALELMKNRCSLLTVLDKAEG